MEKTNSPSELMKQAVPEIDTLGNENTESVTYNNWNLRMKTIVKRIQQLHGITVPEKNLPPYFELCIVSADTDNGCYIISKNKYRLIRKYVLSENFAKHLTQDCPSADPKTNLPKIEMEADKANVVKVENESLSKENLYEIIEDFFPDSPEIPIATKLTVAMEDDSVMQCILFGKITKPPIPQILINKIKDLI